MNIQSEEATRIIREEAKLTLSEGFPQVLLPNVVPVMDMTPSFHKITELLRSNSSSSTGTMSAYTTPNVKNQDFFLTHLICSMTKDATCDQATGRIQITTNIGGTSVDIGSFSVISLTAQDKQLSINFSKPIRIDKNTAISMAGTYTVGTMSRSICIGGYIQNY